MATVLVLGAGSSLAQARHHQPKRPRALPPLDLGFFASLANLAERRPSIRTRIESLRGALGAASGLYDPWARPQTRMEEFFGDIYYALSRGGRTEVLEVFIEAVGLYATAISETTNWLALRQDKGCIESLITKERAGSNAATLTVLTFNQDLVIENACVRLAPTNWCLRCLYNVDLDPLWAQGRPTNQLFRHSQDGCAHLPPLTLLKLHGSLNWGLRTLDARPKRETLFPTERRATFVVNSRLVLQSAVMTGRTPKGRKTWPIWPLLVPPIYEKQRIIDNTVLRNVWDQAEAALQGADRVVLVGYSIPDTDVVTRQMFRSSIRRNAQLSIVDCVNPDPGIVARVFDGLGLKNIRLYESIDRFLELDVR